MHSLCMLFKENSPFYETNSYEVASNRINGGKMIKIKFKYRFEHLKEKFYPSTDLGYYVVYNPETVFFYQ
jgi:hypothetical protein